MHLLHIFFDLVENLEVTTGFILLLVLHHVCLFLLQNIAFSDDAVNAAG